MNKIKTFFHVFINSLYPRSTYFEKIPKSTLSFSLKYFVTFIFLISFITTSATLLQLHYNFGGPIEIKKLKESVDSYPDELRITVSDGKLATNYPKPYIMWYENEKHIAPIFIIDEYNKITDSIKHESFLYMDSKSVTLNTLPIKYTYLYKPYTSFIISRSTAESLITLINSFASYIWLLYALALFIAGSAYFIITFLSKFIFIAICSFILYTTLRLSPSPFAYKQILQISLHSSSFPILLQEILTLFSITLILPFWWVCFYLIFLFAGLVEAHLSRHRGRKK